MPFSSSSSDEPHLFLRAPRRALVFLSVPVLFSLAEPSTADSVHGPDAERTDGCGAFARDAGADGGAVHEGPLKKITTVGTLPVLRSGWRLEGLLPTAALDRVTVPANKWDSDADIPR